MLKKVASQAFITVGLTVLLFAIIGKVEADSEINGFEISEDLRVSDIGAPVKNLQEALIQKGFLDSHETREGNYFYGLSTAMGIHNFLDHHDLLVGNPFYDMGFYFRGRVKRRFNDLAAKREMKADRNNLIEILNRTGKYRNGTMVLTANLQGKSSFEEMEIDSEFRSETKLASDAFLSGFQIEIKTTPVKNLRHGEEILEIAGELIYEEEAYFGIYDYGLKTEEGFDSGLTKMETVLSELKGEYVLIEKDVKKWGNEKLSNFMKGEDLSATGIRKVERLLREAVTKAWEREVFRIERSRKEALDGKEMRRYDVEVDSENFLEFIIDISEKYRFEEILSGSTKGEVQNKLERVREKSPEELEEHLDRLSFSLWVDGVHLRKIEFDRLIRKDDLALEDPEFNLTIYFRNFGLSFGEIEKPVDYVGVKDKLETIETATGLKLTDNPLRP